MIVRSKTFRGWMKANFTRQDLKDMVTHGVSSGFSGLIYYTETAKLYDKFSNEIWDALFKNLLVWYMAERTAQELLEDMV